MENLIYVSIVIFIILYTIGFVMLYMYKKDKIKYLEEQLNSLNNMLESSDQMVNELNNLSDYVTVNIEDKTKELKKLLVLADEKIKDFKLAANYNFKPIADGDKEIQKHEKKDFQNDSIDNLLDDINKLKKPEFQKIRPVTKSFSAVIGAYEDNINLLKNTKLDIETTKENSDNKETSKEVKFETKEDQIEKLMKQGLEISEIAKTLGVGKGEVELILGLKNNN